MKHYRECIQRVSRVLGTCAARSGQNLMMRQSQLALSQRFLGFWRQIAGFNQRCEAVSLVGSVAKRRVRRVTTTAQTYGGAPAQAELLAVLVDDAEVTFDAKRPVVQNRDFCPCQGTLQRKCKNVSAGHFARLNAVVP